MMKNKKIFQYVILILFVIYEYKINKIAINYKAHLKEEREKEKRREAEIKKLKNELSKRNKKPSEELVFNKCVTGKVPKITGMLETSQILRLTNYSLIRFGDSEVDMIRSMNDFRQDYNKTLSERLLEAFNTNDPNVMVGLPNVFDGFPKLEKGAAQWWTVSYKGIDWIYNNLNFSKQYYDTLITSPYISTFGTSCELVNLIYDNMRELFRDKDLIILRGNNSEVYNYDVYEYARSQKIFFAPPRNAWEKYDELKEILLKEDKNALYIIAIGITSEVLVMDLVKNGRRAIDLGHLAKDYDCYMKQIFDRRFFR